MRLISPFSHVDLQFALLVLLEITAKSTLMIVHRFHVITSVHVKTSLVITAVYVGLAGLADTVITT